MNKMAIIELARNFLASRVTAIQFSENICIERRKLYDIKEQDQNVLNCGEELFMIADLFEPDPDRESYELDETGLRNEVKATLEKFHLL
ncbi:TPA: colicin immunity domain-containing protein [Klebsiella oxytoca]|nr:colicin-D [Klebsiella oxytoca]